ncbi:MAG: cupin domain-containing protein [Pseudomonadota bacterium]
MSATTPVPQPALSALFTPNGREEFLRSAWPHRVYASHHGLDALPECLAVDLISDYGQLVKANKGRVAFTNGPQSAHMMPADPKSAPFLPEMGLTVFFEEIATALPGAEQFLRQFEADLGIGFGTASMSAWVSADDNGVACHYDPFDTFSIHIKGEKTWELAPVDEVRFPTIKQYSPGSVPDYELYPQMRDGFPDWGDKEFQTVEMRPGSVLYFPRGTWHRTHASSNTIAITIVLRPHNSIDLLMPQLRALLMQDPQWRQPLYGAWGADGSSEFERLQTLLASLPGRIEQLDAGTLLREALTPEQRLRNADAHTRFQRKPAIVVEPSDTGSTDNDRWITLLRRDERGNLHYQNRLEIPAALFSVVEFIGMSDTPITATDLRDMFPDIALEYHVRLLEVCARSGLLQLLDFPALGSE